ncbi:MAG: hypothetical protein II292_04465 [Clostridia bacterium]|nr:hypothetical protein [Clostridia bacterium]MBQ2385444.1 hypothetical protein [Clostridia bacterium]
MAVEYMNDSYNRCIAELRTRYRGRAVSSSVKDEAVVTEDKSAITESYILFDSRSKIADTYRSGEYNGSKYMTSEDFVRYFRSRRAFYMPSAQKAQEAKAEEAANASVPQRKNGASPASPAESGSKEGHIERLLSVAKSLFVKWFPIERREGRSEGARSKFPVPVLAGIAVFAISMSLIVSGSVMVGDATAIVGKLDSEIATLEAEKSDLEGKLDLKYTVEEIEKDAKTLGMVKREYADSEYVTIKDDDEINIYDDGKEENISLAALLSAFGIELGN